MFLSLLQLPAILLKYVKCHRHSQIIPPRHTGGINRIRFHRCRSPGYIFVMFTLKWESWLDGQQMTEKCYLRWWQRYRASSSSFIYVTFFLHAFNQICRIEKISHLNELQVLNLSGNCISRLENLQGLNSLTELNLRRNCISAVVRNLYPLERTTSL